MAYIINKFRGHPVEIVTANTALSSIKWVNTRRKKIKWTTSFNRLQLALLWIIYVPSLLYTSFNCLISPTYSLSLLKWLGPYVKCSPYYKSVLSVTSSVNLQCEMKLITLYSGAMKIPPSVISSPESFTPKKINCHPSTWNQLKNMHLQIEIGCTHSIG